MNPGRVLFVAEGQLGDLLLLTPALRAVKKAYPLARVSVLVVERRASIARDLQPSESITSVLSTGKETPLSGNPSVDEVLVLDRSALKMLTGIDRVREELRIVRFLRTMRLDVVVCTFPEDRFVTWAYLSGAAVRVGQRDQPLRWMLTHAPDVHKGDRGVLEYYCELARVFDATVGSIITEYRVPESSARRIKEELAALGIDGAEDLVAIHPGATGDYKIWPPERYAALIEYLQQRGDVQIVLCSGILDKPVADAIEGQLRNRVPVVSTFSSIGDLAAVLQRSLLCISNDSGPRHLAVAVGTPTLAFFRRFHNREWTVYPVTPTCLSLVGEGECPVCPEGSCLDRVPEGAQYGSHCIRMVSVETAIEQVGSAINAARSAQRDATRGGGEYPLH